MVQLSRAFAETTGAEISEDLEAVLQARVVAARRAWPDFHVEPLTLIRALAELARRGGSVEVPPENAACDVHLALACADGSSAAMVAFERRYFGNLQRVVAGVVGDAGAVDDVAQRVRDRLFLAPPGGVPPVAEYAGDGDMRRLVDVAALRIALNLKRGDGRRRARDGSFAAEALDGAIDDPELGFIKQTCRAQVKAALEVALASLSTRERNLLRCHLLQHLGIDEIGVMYGVHRSTAARWLAATRAAVAERVRAELRAELSDEGALRDALELARSHLDLSLSRILATYQEG